MLSHKGLFLTFIIYLCTLQYKIAIMNQLEIHDLYNFFLFSKLNHFYVICTIIQNEGNLINTIYNFSFV